MAAAERAETLEAALREIRDLRLNEEKDTLSSVGGARFQMREIAIAALAAAGDAEASLA